MAVKIKDMCVPDSCYDCPLCICIHHYGRHCYITDEPISEWGIDERSEICPMEEVNDE